MIFNVKILVVIIDKISELFLSSQGPQTAEVGLVYTSCSTPKINQLKKTNADFFDQMQFLKLFTLFLFHVEEFIPNPVYTYNFSNSNTWILFEQDFLQ